MKLSLVCIGKPRGTISEAISDYEKRLSHYFKWETVELKETPYRAQPIQQLRDDEGERLLARVSKQNQLIALHRGGALWSSEELAQYVSDAGVKGVPGISFVIGGAYGLSEALLERANHVLSLSRMTFPHEMARLLLAEQIYRAGSISRGEPYHKGIGS